MKLYTEEQVRKIYSIAHKTGDSGYAESFDLDVKELSITPIQVPSDEEISKESRDKTTNIPSQSFMNGAKWMRDKLTKTKEK